MVGFYLVLTNPHSEFGHDAINFPGRTPRLRFDTMSHALLRFKYNPFF